MCEMCYLIKYVCVSIVHSIKVILFICPLDRRKMNINLRKRNILSTYNTQKRIKHNTLFYLAEYTQNTKFNKYLSNRCKVVSKINEGQISISLQ